MSQSSFTVKEVLEWANEISGKGKPEQLKILVREVLEELHNEESVESIRKWCLCSCGCSVTIPNEMQSPTKYKIECQVGQVRDTAYQFRGQVRKDECDNYRQDLEYIGEFPTYYDLPREGAYVAARSLSAFKKGEKEPYILVQGKDMNDQEVYSPQEGETALGVRVPIAEPHKAPIKSDVKFSKITDTSVHNACLNVQIVWCDQGRSGLLSFLSPGETRGCFRRYSLGGCIDGSCCYKLEVLGHLAIPSLKYDNQLIVGFDSSVIRSMLRSKVFQAGNEISGAQFNSSVAMSSLRKKNERSSKKSTDSLNVKIETSACNFPSLD